MNKEEEGEATADEEASGLLGSKERGKEGLRERMRRQQLT